MPAEEKQLPQSRLRLCYWSPLKAHQFAQVDTQEIIIDIHRGCNGRCGTVIDYTSERPDGNYREVAYVLPTMFKVQPLYPVIDTINRSGTHRADGHQPPAEEVPRLLLDIDGW